MPSSATTPVALLSPSFPPLPRPSLNTNGGVWKLAIKRKSSSCIAWCHDAKANVQKGVQDGSAFKEKFFVHFYQVGPNSKATLDSLVENLQEIAFNHLHGTRIYDDSSISPEMTRNNLLWVVTNMQFIVEGYPVWKDTVQVDIWTNSCGENRVHVNCLASDSKTKQTIIRTTSLWMPMNKATRKLSKLPEVVRAKLCFLDRSLVVDKDNRKLQKLSEDTANYVKKGITPEWGDIDVNGHVNNVKYINWIQKSTPMWIHESHELAEITMQYRKECFIDSVVESFTKISSNNQNLSLETGIECEHMLQLEGGIEIVRSRTYWRAK